MSKAFTKEDDAAGVSLSSSSLAIPPGPFRLTATGARAAAARSDPRVDEALARAETLEPVVHPERAALGVTVRARNEQDEERAYRLVSPEELVLLGTSRPDVAATSVASPVGRALLGARVGDVREVVLPRGKEELEVVALEGESAT
ncbi:MAG: GreA/GreB family elongation factor [Labilithrix sp.]|nr:GreA/GreB family elongation factor [Labilithrix sp.]MCW5831221.1 GreA/GreB family elongation factor [Labilithrix sp.]